MIKILFIMSDLEGGGAEKALTNLLNEFDYSRYKVTLCLLYRRGIYLNSIPSHVKVVSLFAHETSFCFRKGWKRYIKYNNKDLLSLLIKCKLRRRYDIIISYLEGLPVFFHSLIMDRGAKNISWIHIDMLKYHSSHNAYRNREEGEKQCYQKMDQLVFVSRIAMANFTKLYDIDIPKCCLYNIVNKIDICQKASMGRVIPKVTFTITAIGSLLEVKGFDRLIRVAGMLKKGGDSFRIQIIGHGEKEQELKLLAYTLNLQNEVCFLGFQTNPYPYLKGSDMFISTSVSEGFSLVICEALTLGIPVVATKTAGAIELLKDGEYGVLVEHDDTSIYKAIKQLVDDRVMRREYSEKAQERSKLFNVQQVMDQVYQLLDK